MSSVFLSVPLRGFSAPLCESVFLFYTVSLRISQSLAKAGGVGASVNTDPDRFAALQ